jgi:hypothetical protein
LKKGRVVFVLSILFLIVSFLPTNLFLPRWSSSAGSYDLAPGNVNGPTVELFYGSLIELGVYISGANKDVYFYITDSHGKRVFDAGRIYDGYYLKWHSPTIGSFKLNFDNSMSWVSHKGVNWSFHLFHYKPLFLFLGLGLLVLAVLQMVREEKVIDKIRKFMVKETESLVVECEYCGATYNKTLDKCPECGARKKVSISRKKKKS